MNFQRILIPVDFSEHSMMAFKAGVALAKQVGGSITILYVLPPIVLMQGEMGPLVVPPEPYRRESIEKELEALRAKVPPEVPAETLVHEGHPWPSICDSAAEKKSDLVVIASHGYTGLKRMLLGSTAEQVVRHACCPVLVVKSFVE